MWSRLGRSPVFEGLKEMASKNVVPPQKKNAMVSHMCSHIFPLQKGMLIPWGLQIRVISSVLVQTWPHGLGSRQVLHQRFFFCLG